MVSGRSMLAIVLASLLSSSVVLGEAPHAQVMASSSSTGGSAYPTNYYSVETKHNDGYAMPSPSYGAPSPSPSYGAPSPSPVYGPPHEEHPFRDYTGLNLDSESSFVQHRLFNTAVAMTVPLFSFTIPQRSSQSGGVDLANQAIFGAFALFTVILVFVVPIFFTKPPGARSTGRSSDRDGILNHLMANHGKVFNFMGADLSNKIGLDSTKCLQKSICEAHRTPKKYGVIATPFQMFFPPPTNGTADTRASIFQIAAKDGKYSKKDCGKKYQCFFDTLDLVSYMADWWKHSSDPNYVLEL